MTITDWTDPALSGRSLSRLAIAVVGGGKRVAAMSRLLHGLDNVVLLGICAPSQDLAAATVAEELGVVCSADLGELHALPELDLIIDMTGDPRVGTALQSARPSSTAVISGGGAELLWDLLVEKKRGEEQQRLFAELQVAYDRIRSHERRLQSSKEALEHANTELESKLAEIFFTHEFFKALTSYTSVDDVCSLVVDGCNGILGAEISCVYLLDREDWTLRLKAYQGRPSNAFKPIVPVSDTILGRAFADGPLQEASIAEADTSAAWVVPAVANIRSHAAFPLRAGQNVVGIMVMASSTERELSATEMDRLLVLSNQASLSLQNALLHAELERLSVTDRLTELYNHGHFRQRLEEEFNRSARFRHPMSLIMLDIDDFKEFNDSYGHVRGDEVLRSVSAIIRRNLREIDIAARYGGEEFVVVLPETGTGGACAVAERIRAGIEGHGQATGDSGVGRTVSVGVATFPHDGDTALKLLEAADSAMYRAKRSGKNRVCSAS